MSVANELSLGKSSAFHVKGLPLINEWGKCFTPHLHLVVLKISEVF